MPKPDEIVIETRDLCRHYRLGDETVRALDQVNLEIPRGVFFGITGASGSGKSTLLYLLGGMDYPTAGQVRVLGQEIGGLDENQLAVFRRHAVGFVYQSFHLIPSMTALENVELPLLLAGAAARSRRKRAAELLEMVGLGQRMQHRPAQMSGGQQQRVAIARALTNAPPVLLADEPTGNLDSRTGQEIICLFRDLVRNERLTIVMVSHDQSAIAAADGYIRMQDGRILSSHSNGNGIDGGQP
jgi:putative ABC transport system ATP-binding protein